VQLTLSIGVAVRTTGMQGFAELLKAADEAVYRAKERGRNQVCLARS
jgi:diguanylate cyclase (GGDEF)-like protein